MKIAIVGSREYPNLNQVVKYVESLPKDTEIISGGARGVDKIAEVTAKRLGLRTSIFLADWDKGLCAGFQRNWDIVRACDILVAFWDGKSRGTEHSISIGKALHKDVVIYGPELGFESPVKE